MLSNRILKEHSKEIIKKGVKIEVDFPNMSAGEFGEKLLIIINNKSYHSVYNIIDVNTFYGTNTIEITTYNEDAVIHLLKQIVDDPNRITVSEKISVINLSDCGVGLQLEELGLIKQDEGIVIIGE